MARVAPFDDTLGNIVRRRFRSADGAQQRSENDSRCFSYVYPTALITDAQPCGTGAKVDPGLHIRERRIAQGIDDTGRRLEPRRQQRVGLHAVALDRHDTCIAAKRDRCGHRQRR